jgi:putative hydrolases of HD superfamily
MVENNMSSDAAGLAGVEDQRQKPLRSDMREDELEGVLVFLRMAERLKTITRSGWTSAGEQESVAEHTWRLCLMAMLLYGRDSSIDLARLLKMCLIHDLGEAIGGDVPAPKQVPAVNKNVQERIDLLQLIGPLPAVLRHEIINLWDEYDAATSSEARVAKGLDKLETILQHTQGRNPAGFDYAYNLEYGKGYTAADPVLTALRARLDEETARRVKQAERAP